MQLQHSRREDGLEKEAARKKRGWKVLVVIGVILLMIATASTVRSNARAPEPRKMYSLKSKKDANSDIAPAVAANAAAGVLVGSGTHWISNRKICRRICTQGTNCVMVCATQNCVDLCDGQVNVWTAVKRGFVAGTGNNFSVCAAWSANPAKPGFRVGFNLPEWNNGHCDILTDVSTTPTSWENNLAQACLCTDPNSQSKWVSNGVAGTNCEQVCNNDGVTTVAVASGAYLNVATNPRFYVCSASGHGFDGRIGWNLNLGSMSGRCNAEYYGSYTNANEFHCYCDKPRISLPPTHDKSIGTM